MVKIKRILVLAGLEHLLNTDMSTFLLLEIIKKNLLGIIYLLIIRYGTSIYQYNKMREKNC